MQIETDCHHSVCIRQRFESIHLKGSAALGAFGSGFWAGNFARNAFCSLRFQPWQHGTDFEHLQVTQKCFVQEPALQPGERLAPR